MDNRVLLFAFMALMAIITCSATENNQISKRASPGDGNAEDELDSDTAPDKRRIFRFGRGVFRYGKRDSAVLYPNGELDDSAYGNDDQFAADKRLFRWGKRGDAYKRLFRWGKRADSLADNTEDDVLNEAKRRVFRFGKRGDDNLDSLTDEHKRRIFRYGRSFERDARAPNEPHVPFRFGEKEE